MDSGGQLEEELLEAGADPAAFGVTQNDRQKTTALHVAIKQGYVQPLSLPLAGCCVAILAMWGNGLQSTWFASALIMICKAFPLRHSCATAIFRSPLCRCGGCVLF